MSKLSEMPVVTVEQIMRFRQAAMAVEQRLDDVRKMYAAQCQLTDDILQQKAELLATLETERKERKAVIDDALVFKAELLEKQNAELLAQISNMYDCIFMADDNAAGHGYDADSSIRRHLGYAMTIANKAKAGAQ